MVGLDRITSIRKRRHLCAKVPPGQRCPCRRITMALHFSPAEFERRKNALLAAMGEARLDALLIFQQESMYWLTGYDTFGFCFFQCLVLTADGRMALLTRSADLRQAQHTSILEDIRLWKDAADANPALDLKALCADFGLQA